MDKKLLHYHWKGYSYNFDEMNLKQLIGKIWGKYCPLDLKNVTVEHLVTVIGIYAVENDPCSQAWFTKKSYKQACGYLSDYFKAVGVTHPERETDRNQLNRGSSSATTSGKSKVVSIKWTPSKVDEFNVWEPEPTIHYGIHGGYGKSKTTSTVKGKFKYKIQK